MFRNECFCNTFRDVMKFSVGYFEFKSTLFARPDWSHKDAGIGSGMEEREKKSEHYITVYSQNRPNQASFL